MQSMVDIPAGTIALRDDRLGTRWQVELSAFRLACFPVTGSADLPLTGLSWYDAIALCNQLSAVDGLAPAYVIDGSEARWDTDSPGYRLPTEAEWQYACTAGMPAYRYGLLDDIAWYADNSSGQAHSVGLKAPNARGGCTTCSATSGSGAGISTTQRRTAPTASSAAAVSLTPNAPSAPPSAAAPIPPSPSKTWASVSLNLLRKLFRV